MRGFTVILMILVGAVFVAGIQGLLAKLTQEYLDATFWIIVVFIYYTGYSITLLIRLSKDLSIIRHRFAIYGSSILNLCYLLTSHRYLRLRIGLSIRIREAYFRSCLLVSLVALSLAFMLPKVH